ncbi:hypothetical protein BJV78DRAFT_1213321 [Lactifluus subvellereus]|nr:hypothetical protein BJV78DRAFT_1213321 [Lactifluus subvellereus]
MLLITDPISRRALLLLSSSVLPRVFIKYFAVPHHTVCVSARLSLFVHIPPRDPPLRNNSHWHFAHARTHFSHITLSSCLPLHNQLYSTTAFVPPFKLAMQPCHRSGYSFSS